MPKKICKVIILAEKFIGINEGKHDIRKQGSIGLPYIPIRLPYIPIRGARGVVVIAEGNEHGDTSSNPGRDWLHFT